MFDNLINKGVSVYINDLYTPTFENYRLVDSENNFVTLQKPDDLSFIYVNINKIIYIARYVKLEYDD